MNIHTNCSESFCFQCILVLSNVAMQGRRSKEHVRLQYNKHTCNHTHTYKHILATTQIHTHSCNYTNTHTSHLEHLLYAHTPHTHAHKHTHACARTHTHTHTYSRTHTHIHAQTHTCKTDIPTTTDLDHMRLTASVISLRGCANTKPTHRGPV